MYDVKSDIKEFVAETPEAARAKAVSFFGIDESEITFRELASAEVAGAAGRVVIVAQPTEMVGQTARAGGGGGRAPLRERPPRDRGGDRDRGGSRERPGRGRGDREARPARGDRNREPRPARSDRDRAPRADRNRERRPAPDEPSVGTTKGDSGPVGDFILGVIERMDLGPFEVTGSEEGRFMVYQLAGVAAEQLTAADSRATEAIQLLANQAAGRLSDEPKRIVVDAEGDRERREAFLSRMAERAARRAKDTGRSVALDPMNARDRRGIHMALRDVENVATMSVGEGLYRQVVVVPEGADEYEEALAGSPDSSSDTQETEGE
jgi:predicted RNA-binding protein Jag